jgi:hypothetical protein
MKQPYTLSIFLVISLYSFGQYNDPNIPKPTTGYGSDGTHTVGIVSFANPNYPAKKIEIYYPSDITTKVPALFYSHAYGGNDPQNIIGLLDFVAMKGYAIVFVPYQTLSVTINERYTNLLEGFRKAARDYPSVIDTTKVGFVGHSFGGGASFANAYKCFTENNWGQNGRFIYALAQWYSYNITQTELQSYPSNTKLLTEIFDDDVTNDHRMAIEIFKNINITNDEKDFILLKSDTINSYIYNANHVVPNTAAAFDALDYYAYYRLLDALCDYTFNGSPAGKNVALGNGSAAQVTMPGGLKSLIQTDNPIAQYPESKYEFQCSDTGNLRKAYCNSSLSITENNKHTSGLKVYPNPLTNNFNVIVPLGFEKYDLRLFNMTGELLQIENVNNRSSLNIDMSTFPSGLYCITIGSMNLKIIKQ